MKRFQLALILALIIPLGGNALATTSPSHSGTSSSYKSGFSSQKSSRSTSNKQKFGSFNSKPASAAPAPAPANASPAPASRGTFGAFGNSANPAPDGQAPQSAGRSALSRDLQQSQSQANALNTLDARRNAANGNGGQALPPLNDRVPGVDRAPQQPYGPAPVPYGQQQPYTQAPVIVQQSGNSGLGAAFMGFMLGRSMNASAHQGYYPSNGAANNTANGATVQQNGSAPAAPAASFGSTVLRTFAWLVLLGVIGWAIYFVVRALKRGKSRRSGANYSFERD